MVEAITKFLIMKISSQIIPEVLLIEPDVFSDERGFFLETARKNLLQKYGIPELIQHNHSRSEYGVLRGLHYQLVNPQGKLVRCSRGEIFDVAVDIRLGSHSFSKWVGFFLDDINHRQLWIPPGFAHGFLVLSDVADVCYSCSSYYHPESENGILWNDRQINIGWPELSINNVPKLSVKDKQFPLLKDQNQDFLPSFI
tara:strand:+ start:3863 stop:4456 length:594 start_codon:yes stop_codon:yes gene_type:complete